jgi:hypothetical protein
MREGVAAPYPEMMVAPDRVEYILHGTGEIVITIFCEIWCCIRVTLAELRCSCRAVLERRQPNFYATYRSGGGYGFFCSLADFGSTG